MDNNKNGLKLSAADGGKAFFGMIALYILISFVGQAVLTVIFAEQNAGYIAVSSTFSVLAFVVVTVLFSVKTETPLKSVAKIQKFNPIYISLSLVLSIGMFLGLGFVNSAFVNLLVELGVTVSSTVIPLDSIGLLILFSFLLAVLPAITEEIFFRGLIFNALSGVKTVIACVIVSLSFALYHCSVQQLLYQFIYGVGLYLLCKASNSVIPCIISHFINNFAVLLLEYFKADLDLFNPIIIAVGLVLLAVFFTVVILQIKKSEKLENGVKNGGVKDFFLPYGIFGAGVCLVMIISSLFVGA